MDLLSFLIFSGMFSQERAAVSLMEPKCGNLVSSPQHTGQMELQLIFRAGFQGYCLQCEPFFFFLFKCALLFSVDSPFIPSHVSI